MKHNRPPMIEAVRRCLGLRCPACGRGPIISSLFRIAEQCSSCHTHFKREEGFFVGALLINVVTTEVVILFAYLISIPFVNYGSDYSLLVLFLIAVTFPVAFYHHSWSFWLTFDHFVEGLPRK